MRPLVRLVAAVLLPLLVPAIITAALWALPGDPAAIICPPEQCGEGYVELAKKWRLDSGPMYFYTSWLADALSLDFGRSWKMMAGSPVYDEIVAATPTTLGLLMLTVLPLFISTVVTAVVWLPRWVQSAVQLPFQAIGMVPAVIPALLAAAYVEITYGVTFGDWGPYLTKLALGALVLALADGAMSGAIAGTRATFEREYNQRYVQIAVLRGETMLSNAVPNVLPALIGQMRGRVLHVLSGTVIVEVVIGIPGLGDLLWAGTLEQDFGIVLAAAFVFALFSGALMFLQAVSEIAVALFVRRSPSGVLVTA